MFRVGYTLIELLATIAIIVILAVTGIPVFSNYQAKTNYDQKIQESEALISQFFTLVKNPDREADAYSLTLDKDQQELMLTLCNESECKKPKEVTKVSYDKSIFIENKATFENRETENNRLICVVPGDECFLQNKIGKHKIVKNEIFFQITNSKLSKSAKSFIIKNDPLGINIE